MDKMISKTLAIVLLSISTLLSSEDTPVVIRGARIYTLDGPVIEKGTLVIEGSRIKAVGIDIPIPQNAKIIEANGFEVVPGYINVGSQVGISEIGSISATQDANELGSFLPQIYTASAVHAASEHIGVTRSEVSPWGVLFRVFDRPREVLEEVARL